MTHGREVILFKGGGVVEKRVEKSKYTNIVPFNTRVENMAENTLKSSHSLPRRCQSIHRQPYWHQVELVSRPQTSHGERPVGALHWVSPLFPKISGSEAGGLIIKSGVE
jgi:hypothetical protein